MSLKLYDNIKVNQGIILDLPFFEGVGDITHDISRYHNNGTFKAAGSPAWAQLASGISVLDFDGDDYFIVPDSPLWALGTEDFSLELWLTRASAGGTGALFSQVQVLAADMIFLYVAGTTPNLQFNLASGGVLGTVQGDIGLTTDAWHHVVVTRQNINTWIGYCDGQGYPLTGWTDFNIPNFNANLIFGAIFNGMFYFAYYNGYVSRIRLIRGHAYDYNEVQLRYRMTRRFYQ